MSDSDRLCPYCKHVLSEHRRGLAQVVGSGLFPASFDCAYEVLECPTDKNKALWAHEDKTGRKIPRI